MCVIENEISNFLNINGSNEMRTCRFDNFFFFTNSYCYQYFHLARSHTFVEIDHEIISIVIFLPSADSRRVVVGFKRK